MRHQSPGRNSLGHTRRPSVGEAGRDAHRNKRGSTWLALRPRTNAMPKPDHDRRQPEPPPVRPPTLPPDFPDIPQNPSSELQPPPDPSATPDKVAGTTPGPAEPETQGKPRPAPEKSRAGA